MKKLRTNLTKEKIALVKGYRYWYRVIGNEVRLFINENQLNNKNQIINKIYWQQNRAELCIDKIEGSREFYEKHKHLQVRLFIRSYSGSLYSEYKVKSWTANNKGLELMLA